MTLPSNEKRTIKAVKSATIEIRDEIEKKVKILITEINQHVESTYREEFRATYPFSIMVFVKWSTQLATSW